MLLDNLIHKILTKSKRSNSLSSTGGVQTNHHLYRTSTTMVLAPSTRDKKDLASVLPRFSKTFDNQQSQTQAKLLLESITRASGEQMKTALRIEQMT